MTTVAELSVMVGANIAGLQRGMRNAASEVNDVARGMRQDLNRFGNKMAEVGTKVGLLTAPLLGLGAVAASAAIQFESSMTNINSILQLSDDEIGALSAEILAFGATTRAGPQAVAQAFYDIVGGVADATTHMAILEAAVATAEAGNADLSATTGALIAVMNSYSYSADEAAYVSDILTQTVAKGVGTMDEFAAALPIVAGLAASAGVSIGEIGAEMAYLTTKGFSASESATKLTAIMTAFLKPNEAMKAALQEMGVESGSAAIEMYGLADTIDLLEQTLGGSVDQMAAALGTTEALTGVIALSNDDFAQFNENFQLTAEGATEAARAIQNMSTQARLDLLKSQVDALTISIGDALLPALGGIVDGLAPVVSGFTQWAQENPERVQQIATITLAVAGLASGMVILGTVIGAATTIFGGLATAVGLVSWPVLALGAAVAGLVATWNALGPGLVESWGEAFRQIGIFIQHVIDKVNELIGRLGAMLAAATSGYDALLNPTAANTRGTRAEELMNAPVPSEGPLQREIPGHASGLSFVPYNNYVARLHMGERVLTARENQAFSGGGGRGGDIHIHAYGRNPAELADMVASELRQRGIGGGRFG